LPFILPTARNKLFRMRNRRRSKGKSNGGSFHDMGYVRGTLLFSSRFIFFQKTVDCRVPDTHLARDAYFPDDLPNPLSYCFDWLREFGRRRKGPRSSSSLFRVPIHLTCGDEDLIIHSGRTYRERYLEGRLSSVFFDPIASLGRRDFRARTCLLQRYVRDSES
jgi:hypothetical protein